MWRVVVWGVFWVLCGVVWGRAESVEVVAGEPVAMFPAGGLGCHHATLNHALRATYSQLVYSESFELPSDGQEGVAGMWDRVGGNGSLVRQDAFNGVQAQGISNGSVRNLGVHRAGVYLNHSLGYEGYLFARSEEGGEVELRLVDVGLPNATNGGSRDMYTVLGSVKWEVKGGGEWQKLNFTGLKPKSSSSCSTYPSNTAPMHCTGDAGACWACSGGVEVWSAGEVVLDQVFVEPGEQGRWKGQHVHYSAGAALAAMGVGSMRYGGTFAKQAGYLWEGFRGFAWLRQPYKGSFDPIEGVSRGWGMFEVADLMASLGGAAVITLNEDEDAESVANFVEYCHGNASTKYGALRIADNHPTPYPVFHIEIGNEQNPRDLQGKYESRAEAILSKAQEVGVGGDVVVYGGVLKVDDVTDSLIRSVKSLGNQVGFDSHVPSPSTGSGGDYGYGGKGDDLKKIGSQAPMAILEVNTDSHSMQRAFQDVAFWHYTHTLRDPRSSTTPPSTLISVLTLSQCFEMEGIPSGHYNQGKVGFTPHTTFLQPPGHSLALLTSSFQPIALQTTFHNPTLPTSTSISPTSSSPYVALASTSTEANKTLTWTFSNPTPSPLHLTLRAPTFPDHPSPLTLSILNASSPHEVNLPNDTHRVAPTKASLPPTSPHNLTLQLPPYAIAVAVWDHLGVFALFPALVWGVDNGYGVTPGMGFDLDYQNPMAPGPGRGNASYVMSIATFFVTPNAHAYPSNSTPKDVGYWMLETDSCWDTSKRDSEGKLVVDPTKYPQGLGPVVSALHSMGLKFGLYGDRGEFDCNHNPGQLGHEESDAAQLAGWEVDWFKVDSCYAPSDRASAFAEYKKIGAALMAQNRSIWYALCGWEPWYGPPDSANGWPGGMGVANSWRIGEDTGKGWSAVLSNLDAALQVCKWSGRAEDGKSGGWADGSLLLNPGTGCESPTHCETDADCEKNHGNCIANQCVAASDNASTTCMTPARARSMFSMWAVFALNLVMTGNLPLINKVQPFVLETWLNSEVIAVNQDPTWNGSAGLYARRLDTTGTANVASATHSTTSTSTTSPPISYSLERTVVQECGGEPEGQEWLLDTPAVGFIQNPATKLYPSLADCKPNEYYDTYTPAPDRETCCGKGCFTHYQFNLTSQGLLQNWLHPTLCSAVNSDRTVTAAPCDASDPNQVWTATTAHQLTNQGLCLTATAPQPPPAANATAIFGRPLQDSAFAALFFNNADRTLPVTCDAGCFAQMGFKPGDKLSARDLYAHETLQENIDPANPWTLRVDGFGASALLKFEKM